MNTDRQSDLRAELKLAGIYPHKSLGQHFLNDPDIVAEIIKAAELKRTDTVLEIGPGLGILTRGLTDAAKQVVAIEADHSLAELLSKDAPSNLDVVASDVLDYDLRQLPKGYKVVANLPYYLTSKIIRLLLVSPNAPARLTIMVQKEVAERICAAPGNLSILALSVQYFCEPSIAMVVGKQNFWPPPKVDSAVLDLVTRPRPIFPAEQAKLFRLIKAGFGEKRKQLKNSLAGGLNLSPELTIEILGSAQIDHTARAQELNWDDWQNLYEQTNKRGLLE